MKKGLNILISIIVLVIIAFLIVIFAGSKIYTDILWFKNLGYLKSYLIMLLSNYGLRILIGAIFTGFLFINLLFTKRPILNFVNVRNEDNNDNVETLFSGEKSGFLKWLNNKRLTYTYLLGSIILGFLFSSISQNLWKIVLKYFNQTSFNTTDPIFGKDLAFYIFSLPFLSFIKEMGMVLIILTVIVIGIIYIIASGINSIKDMGVKLSTRAKTHITLLIAAFLFLKAWDYRLDMYNLLYSPRGLVFGAGYTDINANLIGLKILFFIAIAIGLLVLFSLFRKNYKAILYGLGVLLVAVIILGSVYPGVIQQFRVEPNEIQMEKEYISHNIDMTLKAYGLSDINKKDFEISNEFKEDTFSENEEVISDMRLWDPRPLESTYSQLQELRQYYDFINVDIDRYQLDGNYRQVMLSVRELNQDKLSGQAKTWINQKLKYTHGFGLAMSPVNKVTTEGMPEFFIKNIPPQVSTNINLENSSIYYGEKTDEYVIGNTNSKEFHYPKGDENVYISYDGNGGVEINNLFRKALYAVRYSNLKFLLNSDINNESRIMYYRNIKERVRKVAPFLRFDSDPYPVIHKGRIFWIQDAYTTSSNYPYSKPVANDINYIRNSIKVVIDAYNGDVKLYIIDESDPLAMTYKKIFPELFVSGDELPEELRAHLRYPKDLFQIQANLYGTYHMEDPLVFYNKEDLWNIPNENYAGNNIQVEPYYIMSKLPGEENKEFILMLPFTPASKNNMIAWMAARMDGEHYGELLVYNFPKDKLVYGPNQIESRIDQDSDISQLLTLWSQRGSRVIRGNLLVIPVKNSILYIEPIYLQAETSELPQLKRVVVSYEDQVIMRNNLKAALSEVFGLEDYGGDSEKAEQEAKTGVILPDTINSLANKAVEIYEEAIEEQKSGNWGEYGDKINELKELLNELQDKSNIDLEETE